MLKMLKRARARQPLELAPASSGSFTEADEVTTTNAPEKNEEPKAEEPCATMGEKKESLSDKGTVGTG
jgi:hypothetical protein